MAQNYLNRGSSGTLNFSFRLPVTLIHALFDNCFREGNCHQQTKQTAAAASKPSTYAPIRSEHHGDCHGRRCQPALDGICKSLYEVRARGYAHCSMNGCCSFLFISITSHQNSSPSEVATVPLAIKIVLGHATLVCDSAVGNKSSGSSGNDADSRVVNLERCRREREL